MVSPVLQIPRSKPTVARSQVSRAARTMLAITCHPEFSAHAEYANITTDFFSNMTDDKRAVARSILARTNPSSSDSVDELLGVMAELNDVEAYDSGIAHRTYGALARDWRTHLPVNMSEDVINAIELSTLEQRLGRSVHLKSEVRDVLIEHDVMRLLSFTPTFMMEKGIRVLNMLLDDLQECDAVNGKIDYRQRYQRMIDPLGFSPYFVERWARDWQKEVGSGASMRQDAREVLVASTVERLKMRSANVRTAENRFKGPLSFVSRLIEDLSRGFVGTGHIESVRHRFHRERNDIAAAYGFGFTRIVVDLDNLLAGLRDGVRLGMSSENVLVTGRPEILAWYGYLPIPNCQSLVEESLYNLLGQPISRMRWGQTKFAMYNIDGEVAASHLIEATYDAAGEHIIVEPLYRGEAIANLSSFDLALYEHAANAGIPAERVHFLDYVHRDSVPGPIRTGDAIHRLVEMEEVSPNRVQVQQDSDPIP